jgi:hypothetical protein
LERGRRLRMRGRGKVTALAATAAVVLAASVAWATIPDGNGVIHGCYLRKGGALRVINTGKGQTCTGKEKSLTWNQTGPAGPAGPPGVSGYVVSGTNFSPTVNAGDQWSVTVSCPMGKSLLGGGFTDTSAGWSPLRLVSSGPYQPQSTTTWTVTVMNDGANQVTRTLWVWVICGTVQS